MNVLRTVRGFRAALAWVVATVIALYASRTMNVWQAIDTLRYMVVGLGAIGFILCLVRIDQELRDRRDLIESGRNGGKKLGNTMRLYQGCIHLSGFVLFLALGVFFMTPVEQVIPTNVGRVICARMMFVLLEGLFFWHEAVGHYFRRLMDKYFDTEMAAYKAKATLLATKGLHAHQRSTDAPPEIN